MCCEGGEDNILNTHHGSLISPMTEFGTLSISLTERRESMTVTFVHTPNGYSHYSLNTERKWENGLERHFPQGNGLLLYEARQIHSIQSVYHAKRGESRVNHSTIIPGETDTNPSLIYTVTACYSSQDGKNPATMIDDRNTSDKRGSATTTSEGLAKP